MVIDDDEDDFFFLRDAIQKLYPEIDVKHVSNCSEALQYDGAFPDLVFLDLNMPEYDGFYWLNGIREKFDKELPVIVFTTSSNTQHISKAYKDGANLYFTKPNTFSTLVKGVQKILEMNWQYPSQVTKHFFNENKCAPLQVA